MHIVAVGGSDAGISAALRARELDPTVEVTVVVADAYPNFSICGIPYYISGEVTHWRNLAHRSHAERGQGRLWLSVERVLAAARASARLSKPCQRLVREASIPRCGIGGWPSTSSVSHPSGTGFAECFTRRRVAHLERLHRATSRGLVSSTSTR